LIYSACGINFIRNKIKIILLIRATVYGLWVTEDPYRVSSGYITKDTKVIEEDFI
jgi:hypothetical protein